jgi:hypothetical protein
VSKAKKPSAKTKKKAPAKKRAISPIGGGQGGFMTATGTTSSSTRG